MRYVLIGCAAIVASFALDATPASAQQYPWCQMFSIRTGILSCGFVSFEQCRATVSGVGGLCVRNPAYSDLGPRPILRHRPRHHH